MPAPWERLFWQHPPGFPGWAPGRLLGRSSRLPRDDALGFERFISKLQSSSQSRFPRLPPLPAKPGMPTAGVMENSCPEGAGLNLSLPTQGLGFFSPLTPNPRNSFLRDESGCKTFPWPCWQRREEPGGEMQTDKTAKPRMKIVEGWGEFGGGRGGGNAKRALPKALRCLLGPGEGPGAQGWGRAMGRKGKRQGDAVGTRTPRTTGRAEVLRSLCALFPTVTRQKAISQAALMIICALKPHQNQARGTSGRKPGPSGQTPERGKPLGWGGGDVAAPVQPLPRHEDGSSPKPSPSTPESPREQTGGHRDPFSCRKQERCPVLPSSRRRLSHHFHPSAPPKTTNQT